LFKRIWVLVHVLFDLPLHLLKILSYCLPIHHSEIKQQPISRRYIRILHGRMTMHFPCMKAKHNFILTIGQDGKMASPVSVVESKYPAIPIGTAFDIPDGKYWVESGDTAHVHIFNFEIVLRL